MKPHVAFLPSPGMGHIIPLFHVSFLVITTNASAAQNNFFHSAAAISPDLRIIDIPPADISGIISDDMRILTQISVITRESLKLLKPILNNLDPVPVSLIIDIFTTDAIEICEELSIPVYSFFTDSSALLTFSLYLPTLDREVKGELIDLPSPIDIPGCKPLRTADLLDQVKDRKNEEYDWYLLHVSRLSNASGIFVNAWENLDPERFRALKEHSFFKNIPTPPVFPIGPQIKEEEILSENDAEILAWLDSQPRESVLFVCLGSGGTLSSKQLIELCWGLEMSGQRFILTARKPTDSSASGAYFSAGTDEDDPSTFLTDEFLKKTKGVGIVVPSWAPQVAVLLHSSTVLED